MLLRDEIAPPTAGGVASFPKRTYFLNLQKQFVYFLIVLELFRC